MKKYLLVAIALMMSVCFVGDVSAQMDDGEDSSGVENRPTARGNNGRGEQGSIRGRGHGGAAIGNNGRGEQGSIRGRGNGAGGKKGNKGQGGQRGGGGKGKGKGKGNATDGRQIGGAEFINALFQRYDNDQDGGLSATEAPQKMKQRFDSIDTDDNGLVSREELSKALKQVDSQTGLGKGQGQQGQQAQGKGNGGKDKGKDKGKGRK